MPNRELDPLVGGLVAVGLALITFGVFLASERWSEILLLLGGSAVIGVSQSIRIRHDGPDGRSGPTSPHRSSSSTGPVSSGSAVASARPAHPFAAVSFPEARSGYDRGQVDFFLVELGHKVDELQELVRATEQRAYRAEAELAVAAARAGEPTPVGDVETSDPAGDAEAIAPIRFNDARPGYDRDRVDQFLDVVRERIAAEQARLREADDRVHAADLRLASIERPNA